MTSVKWSILAITACALIGAAPLAAASRPAAKISKDMKPAAAVRRAWPQETLAGKVTMVDPAKTLVVVATPDGVTYDMVVTAKTRVQSGDQKITLKDLTRDKDKTVSVKFTPERRGDVARSIRINR
jgi:hypothetical protein